MSKVVARALDDTVSNCRLWRTRENNIGDRFTNITEQLTALIRAVDAQYPEGYDEAGGFTVFGVWGQPEHLKCRDCFGRDEIGHADNCHSWNTRVALLALCRDILGERP